MSRVGRGLWRGLSIVAVLGCVGLAVAVHLLGWQVTRVLSPSMEPTYGAGDLVVLRAIDTDALAVGDIPALVELDDAQVRVVHRVVSVTHRDGETDVVTRGDANPVSDTPVTITGPRIQVVTARIPLSRIGPDSLVFVVGAGLVALAGWTVLRRRRETTSGGPPGAEGPHPGIG